jgi:hypothetical protein
MSRRHLIAALAGVVLVFGLAAPAARAQRCPYQMQMWYHVQMQQWSSQRQVMQTQRWQPAPNYRVNEVQNRTPPRPVERPPSWQVHPEYGVMRTTQSSLTPRRTIEPGREVLHRETFSVTHPDLHLHLSGQLLAAWKGVTNFLGWGGVAPQLDGSLRGPAAYVLGVRYLRVKNMPEKAEAMFRAALADAASETTLRRLAQAQLDRLKNK